MKGNMFLTRRYMKYHRRQQVTAVLVLSLFASAILSMLFLTQCFHATNVQKSYDHYGSYSGQQLFADEKKVQAAHETLQEQGDGIVTVQAQLLTNNEADPVYMGYMDENARRLRAVRVKKGYFPKNEHEIALDQNAYYRLGLTAQVGEEITLKLKQNGTTINKNYKLTGVLYDYGDHWKKISQDLLLQGSEAGMTDPQFPAVLSGVPPTDNALAVHVLYAPDTKQMNLGGLYQLNFQISSAENYIKDLDKFNAFETLLICCLFLILSVFGTWVLANVTLQSREKFTQTLQCVGLTFGELRAQFLIQGILLALSAWLLSIPLSFGILEAILYISKVRGTLILFSVSWWMPLVSLLLILTVTVIIFYFQACRLQDSRQNRVRRKKEKHVSAARNFQQLWSKLYRKSRYGRMTAITVICVGCILILEFGTFSGEVSAATHFYGSLKAHGELDYYVYVEQGANYVEVMDANLPRDNGMSAQQLALLRKNPDLEVQSAYTDSTMMPAFIREKENSSVKQLEHTFDTVNNPDKDEESAKIIKTARQAFGYTDKDILITRPHIIAVDKETMIKLLQAAKRQLSSENLDKFVQGKTVYALGTDFQKGDNFTISMPIVPEGSTCRKLNGKGTSKDFDVSVQDSFVLPQNIFKSTTVFPCGTRRNPCIVLSAEAAMRADLQLRYSDVCVNCAYPDNAESCARASDTIHRAAAASKGMGITDRLQNIADWPKRAQQLKWPVYALTITLLCITMAAVITLNQIKMKSNLHSYALLCAVGMEPERLRRKLIGDSVRSTVIGCLIGGCIGAVLCTLLIRHYFYVPLLPTWVIVTLPITLLGVAAAVGITAVFSAICARHIIKDSIINSLTEQY